MASVSKLVHLVVVALLCFVLVQSAAGRNCGDGCFYTKKAAQHGRDSKILYGNEGVWGSRGENFRSTLGNENGESFQEWELRKVPSGPDPLHHNGGSPKKPRTP